MATDTREPQAQDPPVASPLDRRVRLTVDRYYDWIERGVFRADDSFYLWKGWLVERMTKNQTHVIALGNLNELLIRIVPAGWYVAPEAPIVLGDASAPEPDITVVRGARRDYPHRPPTARDVALVVEVADSSLAEDRGDVLQQFARHSIPIYWIVNIPKRCIEVYTGPTGEAGVPLYRVLRQYLPGEEVPVVIDGREVGRVAVADVLP